MEVKFNKVENITSIWLNEEDRILYYLRLKCETSTGLLLYLCVKFKRYFEHTGVKNHQQIMGLKPLEELEVLKEFVGTGDVAQWQNMCLAYVVV